MRKHLLLALPLLLATSCHKKDQADPKPPVDKPVDPLPLEPLPLIQAWEKGDCSTFDLALGAEDRQWAEKLLNDKTLQTSRQFPDSSFVSGKPQRKKERKLTSKGSDSILEISYAYDADGRAETQRYIKTANGSWSLRYRSVKNIRSEGALVSLTYDWGSDLTCWIHALEESGDANNWKQVSRYLQYLSNPAVEGGWERKVTNHIQRSGEKIGKDWSVLKQDSPQPDGSFAYEEKLLLHGNEQGRIISAETFRNKQPVNRHSFSYDGQGRLEVWKTELPSGDTFAVNSVQRYDWASKKRRLMMKIYPGYENRGDSSYYSDQAGIFQLVMVPFDSRTCYFNGGNIYESCFVKSLDELEYFGLQGREGASGKLTSAQATLGIGGAFSLVLQGTVQSGTCTLDAEGMDCSLRTEVKAPNSLSCAGVDLENGDFWNQTCTFRETSPHGNLGFDTNHNHEHIITKNPERWVYEYSYQDDGSDEILKGMMRFHGDGRLLGTDVKYDKNGVETLASACDYSYDKASLKELGSVCQEFADNPSTTRVEITTENFDPLKP